MLLSSTVFKQRNNEECFRRFLKVLRLKFPHEFLQLKRHQVNLLV